MNNRWGILALLYLTRISLALQFQSLPPVSSYLYEEMAFNLSQFGLLMGLFMLPGVFMSVPAGMMGARLGDKAVVQTGLALLTLGGLLFSASWTFPMAFAARLVGGIGLVLVNVQLTKITTDLFSGKELSTAMGILMSAFPIGSALSFTLLAPIASATSWRFAIATTGLYPALCFLFFAAFFRQQTPGDSPRKMSTSPIWRINQVELRLILLAGLCWAFFNAGVTVFLSFTPSLLVSNGFTASLAAVFVGVASWVSVCMNPIGGWLADRSGKRKLLLFGGSLGSALMVFGLAEWGMATPIFWIAGFGMLYGILPANIMSLPGQLLSPEHRATGLGVYYTVYSLGVTIFPPIAGWLGDVSGRGEAPLYFSSVMMAAITVAFLGMIILQRKFPY